MCKILEKFKNHRIKVSKGLLRFILEKHLAILEKKCIICTKDMRDDRWDDQAAFLKACCEWHDQLKSLGVLNAVRKTYVDLTLEKMMYYFQKYEDRGKEFFRKLKNEVIPYLEITEDEIIEYRLNTLGTVPAVSVVMPVYNAQKYLHQALDSLLNQSASNIEIIAVDDGSTDKSLEILKQYEKKSQRIHVYTQKNQYAGVARNQGLSHAKGEYVIFLDADDFFERDLVRDTYCMAVHHDADIVLFGANHYNQQTGESVIGNYLDLDYAPSRQPFSWRDCPDKIFQIGSDCPWTKLFKRVFLEKTGLQFQDLYNANDIYFVLSAIAMADRIVTLDKQYVNYRVGLKENLQSSQKRYFLQAYYAFHDQLKKLDRLDVLRKSYTNCVLNGCVHNLRLITDIDLKRELFERLKNEAFPYLEITEQESDYYYNKRSYRDMMRVFYVSFERYMEAYVQSGKRQ